MGSDRSAAPARPHRLGIGTAQFGLDYGLTSDGAPVDEREVGRILATARAHSVRLVDTAAAYGTSEAVLGRAIAAGDHGDAFRVVTKLSSLQAARGHEKRHLAKLQIEQSLQSLGVRRLDGLMLHDARDLHDAEAPAIVEQLRAWRAEGLVRHIGASVYEARDIDRLLALGGLDLVQLPFNIFDQRLRRSGHLAELGRRGVEVHVRSALLQGMLLMEVSDLPDKLRIAAGPVTKLRAITAELGLSPLAAALGFVAAVPEIDHIVVGIHSSRHLVECLAASAPADERAMSALEALAVDDPGLIDPRRWSQTS